MLVMCGFVIVVLLLGFGKIIFILVILCVLKNRNFIVCSVKLGFDYIDLKFYVVVIG